MTEVVPKIVASVRQHRGVGKLFLGQVADLGFLQHPLVFSPELCFNVEEIVRAFPFRQGETLWEVGCGVGALAIIAALRYDNRVVATDINPLAVELAQRNAARHNVMQRVDCRVGSLFDPLRANEQFDTIYWNWPYSYVPTDHILSDALEIAFCDPGYRLIDEFLAGVANHVAPGGRLILTFGSMGNAELFDERAHHHGYRLDTLFEKTLRNGRTYWLYSLALPRTE